MVIPLWVGPPVTEGCNVPPGDRHVGSLLAMTTVYLSTGIQNLVSDPPCMNPVCVTLSYKSDTRKRPFAAPQGDGKEALKRRSRFRLTR